MVNKKVRAIKALSTRGKETAMMSGLFSLVVKDRFFTFFELNNQTDPHQERTPLQFSA